MTRHHTQAGVTLLELIIAITLVAILLAMASPSWNSLISRTQHQGLKNDLIGLINLARTTAIMESTNVTLCPLNEQQKCVKDWSRDIVVFRDPDRTRQLDNPSQIVRVMKAPARGHLQGNTGLRPYFGFRPDGIAREAIGNIIWCPQDLDPRNAFQIRINMGGRPLLARDTSGDGVVENAQGKPVACS